jgi:CTP-dependent riboflavin kinase
MGSCGSAGSLRTLALKGKVFSGKGEGRKFTELEWVRKQIESQLGFTPCLGTLNARLDRKATESKKTLSKIEATAEIVPSEDFSSGKCYEAHLLHDVKCALVVPQIANYPEDVIEIIAPVNLREKLRLKDGDTIEIKIRLR